MNRYECPEWKDDSPRHISASVRKILFEENASTKANQSKLVNSTRKYEIYYDFLVGGVLCMKPHVYESINGFSNEYYNWGGEDDGNKVKGTLESDNSFIS